MTQTLVIFQLRVIKTKKMRELLIKVIDMLNNQDWFIDKEKALQMYDRFNITAHFAKQGDYTCFFFIDNMKFEHIVYKNPQFKTKRSN